LEKGPDSSDTTYDLVFDARFEPDRGYYLVLGGRSEVQAETGHRVSASLSVEQCGLQIEWRPARPVEGVSTVGGGSMGGGPGGDRLSDAGVRAPARATEAP
jgi:hypothetical protein